MRDLKIVLLLVFTMLFMFAAMLSILLGSIKGFAASAIFLVFGAWLGSKV